MILSSNIASSRVPCGTLALLLRIAHFLWLNTGADSRWAEMPRGMEESALRDLEHDNTSSKSRK
jgi:hypothetical protein